MNTERDVQPSFSLLRLFSSLAIAVPILAMAAWIDARPTRQPGVDAVVAGSAEAVPISPDLKAWHLRADDPRFGGLSALASVDGGLIALSDQGVVVRFAAPRRQREAMRFALHDLPAGPGSPMRKGARDSESLLADTQGRGWWVGFEMVHSLWLYDQRFSRVIERRRLEVDWIPNKGGEALVAEGDAVAVYPETGGKAAGSNIVAPAWTSDATRLPDGRLVLLKRSLTWGGFENEVRIAAGAGQPARRIALPLGSLDNMEGIAAAPMRGGGVRLWIVSDDNFRPWMRTLLVALDLPAGT